MFKFKSVGEVLGGFCDNIVCAYLMWYLDPLHPDLQKNKPAPLQIYKKLTGKQKPNKKQTTKMAIKHQAANQKNNCWCRLVFLISLFCFL
jgi:hypothetical protein